jgi:hypothetical protein
MCSSTDDHYLQPTPRLHCPVVSICKSSAPRHLFQLDVARALLAGQDVINLAATGLGKTLSFWIPLLHWKAHKKPGEPEKIVLVVTPLNILGGQNEAILKEAGILGIAIDGNDIGDGTIWKLCVLVWPNTHMLIIFPEN